MKNSMLLMLLETCYKRNVDAEIILQPKKYRDGAHAAARARILKALKHERNLSAKEIQSICPLTTKRIQAIVRNGV